MEPLRQLDMLLTLDGKGPRYSQITRAIRRLIDDGVLAFDARLPATRELAQTLGSSRNIVLLAYEQLVLEGYLVTRQGAGTFVASAWPRPSGAATAMAPGPGAQAVGLSKRGRLSVEMAERGRSVLPRRIGLPIDFVYGLCEPDPRLVLRLRAAFSAALRSGRFPYGHPAGDRELREQVSNRIRAARGITCAPEQIVITSGAQQGLDICVRLLLDPGDRIVVEDPGYSAANAIFAAAGAKVIGVPVDRHGLDPAALPRQSVPIRAVYVTPSHQFPSGAVMSVARRHALLEWAKRRGAYIIEDDYDGEFRYAGQPIAALAGLDAGGTVIYCGTFAKTLFPSIRLGYLVAPPGVARALASGKWLCDLASPWLLQHALARLMASGEYDRHIRRMRARYRGRRQALLSALRRRMGGDVEIEGSGGGLHVVVWLRRLPPDRLTRLIDACAERGVGVNSVEGHAIRPLPRPGLLIGYGLTDVEQIERGVAVLAEVHRSLAAKGRRRK